MLVIHHLGISQSDRIVWLCEELGLDYELKRYERDSATRMAPAAYKTLTPFGTAPVITDGDLVLGESGAILEYIMQVYGEGKLMVGPGAPGYTDYLFWYHFANGSLMPAVMMGLVRSRLRSDRREAQYSFVLRRRCVHRSGHNHALSAHHDAGVRPA